MPIEKHIRQQQTFILQIKEMKHILFSIIFNLYEIANNLILIWMKKINKEICLTINTGLHPDSRRISCKLFV